MESQEQVECRETDRAGMLAVRIEDTEGNRVETSIGTTPAIIGRGAEAAIRLDHAMVSRRHAEIVRRDDGRWMIRDLGSRNGTLVNGQAVSSATLSRGDRIEIGPFRIAAEGPGLGEPSAPSTKFSFSEGAPTNVSFLSESGLAALNAAHIRQLNEIRKGFLSTDGRSGRMVQLCAALTTPPLAGLWAAILRLREDSNGHMEMLSDGRRQGTPDDYIHVSRSLLAAVRERREAVMAGNVSGSGAADVQMSMYIASIGAIACPLIDDAWVAGSPKGSFDVLYVVVPASFATREWLALTDLAARELMHSEAHWTARRQAQALAATERELERARQIQMRLVPAEVSVGGLDVSVLFQPCRQVGGDYVDALPLGGSRLLVAIADVCGKGLPAALIASTLHAMVHVGAARHGDIAELLTTMNHYVRQTLNGESFVTMFLATIDGASGKIEYACAGHPPALAVGLGGNCRWLDKTGGLPLGLAEEAYTSATDNLEPDEALSLYTDGLTELTTVEGQMLGMDGLSAEILAAGASDKSARDAAAALSRRLATLRGPAEAADDCTFLIARRVALA